MAELLRLLDEAHFNMSQADQAFTNALIARYGKRADDMRYRTSALPASIQSLALEYQASVAKWRELSEEARRKG